MRELGALFQHILAGTRSEELERQFPFYPLNAPGMPLPGSDFITAACAAGDPPPIFEGRGSSRWCSSAGPRLQYLYRRALYDDEFELPVNVKGRMVQARTVPGHLLGDNADDFNGGPRRARIMLIGKFPGREEVQQKANLVGETSACLWDAADQLGISPDQRAEWYVTNLVKWPQLDKQGDGLPTAWKQDCAILLAQELRLVQPDYILCLGSDASKWLLGTAYGVEVMTGRVIPYRIPTFERGEAPRYHEAKVMTIMHPAYVYRRMEAFEAFKDQLGLFMRLTEGVEIGARENVKHVNVYKYGQLMRIVEQIRKDSDPLRNIIGVDAEWHGRRPGEPGSYLRTVQFSAKEGEAYTVVLRHQGGEPAFVPSIAHAVAGLNCLLQPDAAAGWQPRPGGHFFRSDLPWLLNEGIDLRDSYVPPENIGDMRDKGGWDTSLAYHSVNETASYDLSDMTIRLTNAPRYDEPLMHWRDAYCKENKITKKKLDGYGMCLHQDSKVQLANGTWVKIAKLVHQRYTGQVRACVNGCMVASRVTDWHANNVGQSEWLRVQTQSTLAAHGHLYGPRFTPDHQVMTPRGKVRVDALIPGEDSIITDEPAFSKEQLSVLLACGLGDGGFIPKGRKSMSFGFGQTSTHAAYAVWKAAVFAEYAPKLRQMVGCACYVLPTSRQLCVLAQRFPRHTAQQHSKRKLVLTHELLANLGPLGLAVWYQDDGTLVRCGKKACNYYNSRIYCTIVDVAEQQLAVHWLTQWLGAGVSYKGSIKGGFLQFSKVAFRQLHTIINPYMHPCMAYKTPLPVFAAPVVQHTASLFCDPVVAVLAAPPPPSHKGNGVRYCLTTDAGNFLTKVGFVSNCPSWVMHPEPWDENPSYSNYDADVTRRIIMRCMQPGGLLDSDWFKQPSWEPYWVAHRASLGFLEMEMNGIRVDHKRLDELANLYVFVRENLLQAFRDAIRWPSFNPRSHPQCRAFLFGSEWRFKLSKDGQPVSIVPEGAVTLDLAPIKTTGKRSKMWAEILARGESTSSYTPSTDKEVLGILGHQHRLAMQLRDLKFIAQAVSGVLRDPEENEDGSLVVDDEGHQEYSEGLATCISSDGRVHTHLSQTKETGRAASWDPNLQALAKRRESDYARIMGTWEDNEATRYRGDYQHVFPRPLYEHPIRSIFCATDDYVLVEADYIGAELAMIAWASGDPNMIDHVRRNELPESHPDHYDIHSRQAVTAFHLDCTPTKSALKRGGYTPLRIAAKNVNFGVPYGRAALAIARQCKEEGVDVTSEDTQRLIDAYFAQYPYVAGFLETCRIRSQPPFQWLMNWCGRRRRFIASRDEKVIGEQQRQAQNCTIQGGVADAINISIQNLRQYRAEHPECHYRMLLQIHDALLFEVPVSELAAFAKDVRSEDGTILQPSILRECMCSRVPIWPRHPDGTPMEMAQPYHFGIDVEVALNWGEKITPEQCALHGIDPALV
jgi:uracil-DNA glycosylase family 4